MMYISMLQQDVMKYLRRSEINTFPSHVSLIRRYTNYFVTSIRDYVSHKYTKLGRMHRVVSGLNCLLDTPLSTTNTESYL